MQWVDRATERRPNGQRVTPPPPEEVAAAAGPHQAAPSSRCLFPLVSRVFSCACRALGVCVCVCVCVCARHHQQHRPVGRWAAGGRPVGGRWGRATGRGARGELLLLLLLLRLLLSAAGEGQEATTRHKAKRAALCCAAARLRRFTNQSLKRRASERMYAHSSA